jgi:CheY-like chemotaxis protein
VQPVYRSEMSAGDLARLRVLVIDDNEDNADMLAALLEEYGHAVRVARDGTRGLELVAEEVPDLVLLDIGLPDLDGYEVAVAMRAGFGAGFRIVALTGHGGSADRERARQSGIDSFVTKPLRPRQLAAILASALGPGGSEPG